MIANGKPYQSGRGQRLTPPMIGSWRNSVLRLCSVSAASRAQGENAVFSIARTRCQETQCSLFPIYCRLPKLDVAGSNPVSRSIFSMTYREPNISLNPLFEVTRYL